MQSAQQIYANEVFALPPSEQLRLATLILEGLTGSAAGYCDYWSEEDIQDVTAFSAKHGEDAIS